MTRFIEDTISAICYEIVHEHNLSRGDASQGQVERFVRGQLGRMPKLMGIAVRCATAMFGATAWFHGLRVFHRQPAERRALHWLRWKCSSMGPCRDFVRLYESLVTLSLYSAAGWENIGGASS